MATLGGQRVVRRKPHFFKVLLGDFSHQLQIPPAFAKYISKQSSNNVILKGPGGDQWWVNISEGSCNDFYFDAGWKAFVKDHSLHEHDFLVFKCNGRLYFSVRIFNKTACEREDAFSIKNSQESAYEARGKGDGSEEIKADFHCLHTQTRKSKKRNREQFESGRFKPSQKVEMKNKQDFNQPTSRVNRKVCLNPDSFSSKFPYFRKCLSKTNVMSPHKLYIPKDFLAHLPKNRSKFTVEDPKGKNWEVLINHGHRNFSGGMFACFRGNNLNEGDTCIFELFEKSRLRVHVFSLKKDVGQKTSSSSNGTKKDFDCHLETSKKHSRVQFESGHYKAFNENVQMKNKLKAYHNQDSFSSKFPYFRRCLSNRDVLKPSSIYIPKGFHGYLPKNRRKFTLTNSNGKKWEVFINHGRRLFFSRGMAAFCRGNNMKEGDTCIFELLESSMFRVHVYHVEDMGHKTASGMRHVADEMKKDFGCHFQKSKERRRVQFKSGTYEPSALKVTMKNKLEFHQFTPIVKAKVCHNPDSFSSKFPFFRKCLPKISVTKNLYMMYIPASFHRYLPKNKSKVILRDPNGKNWETFISHGSGKIALCPGWSEFCLGNNLKMGNVCMFELLNRSTFQVHVYPVGG